MIHPEDRNFLKIISGRRYFRFILSLLIAVIVAGFSIAYRSALASVLMQVHTGWGGAGLIFYGVNYILRALRLRLISGGRIGFWPNALYASSLHGFITYLIPLQAGDISLPVILKSTNDIEMAEGSAILIRIRLLDMMSLGGVMVAAALFSRLSLPLAFQLIWIASGAGLFLLPVALRRLVSRKHIPSQRFDRFFRFFAQAGKFRVAEILLSFGIWGTIACVFFCVIRAVNLPLGFGAALLLISLQLPLQVLPVQGFANTGNHEGGWVAALSLLGIPLGQAAEFAVASHIIILFYVLILGIVPLISASYQKTKKQ